MLSTGRTLDCRHINVLKTPKSERKLNAQDKVRKTPKSDIKWNAIDEKVVKTPKSDQKNNTKQDKVIKTPKSIRKLNTSDDRVMKTPKSDRKKNKEQDNDVIETPKSDKKLNAKSLETPNTERKVNQVNNEDSTPSDELITKKSRHKKQKTVKSPSSTVQEKNQHKSKISTESATKKKKSKLDADGFCPPKGIVHESVGENISKIHGLKSKKRKLDTDDSPEANDSFKQSNIKKVKRDESKDNQTVFVGNVPLSAKKSTVLKLFKAFGKVENMRYRCPPRANPKVPFKSSFIRKEFHPERSNIVCYICFEDETSALDALQLNGHELEGYSLRVDLASNSEHDSQKSVFIGNIAYDTEENALNQVFKECGTIENIRIVRDRQTGLGKGFAYVRFSTKESVDKALKLSDPKVNGRSLRVSSIKAKPLKPTPPSRPREHPAEKRVNRKSKSLGGSKVVSSHHQRPGSTEGNESKPFNRKSHPRPSNFRPGETRKPKFKKIKRKKEDVVKKVFSGSKPTPTSSTGHVRF